MVLGAVQIPRERHSPPPNAHRLHRQDRQRVEDRKYYVSFTDASMFITEMRTKADQYLPFSNERKLIAGDAMAASFTLLEIPASW